MSKALCDSTFSIDALNNAVPIGGIKRYFG